MKNEGKTALIGVDLGGTNIRAGVVEKHEIKEVSRGLIPKTENPKDVVNSLIDVVKKIFNDSVAGIGIGVPGLVDQNSGLIYELTNIPSWQNIELGKILRNEFGVPVYVNNDANCFATGECYYGAGKKFTDFVGLITGTGLGAGIISNRKLLSGKNCGAGEFGAVPYLEHDLEVYASGKFFKHFYQKDAYNLFQDATQGNESAKIIFQEYGKHLGMTIKVIVAALNPQAVLIGGGVSNAFEFYQKSMWAEIGNFQLPKSVESLVIEPSTLPEIAILGAAGLYHSHQLQIPASDF